jgi:hypothetical protein
MKELKIGDKVKLNQTYFDEGLAYFGKELRYPRQEGHYFTITNIGNDNGEQICTVDGGSYKELPVICGRFLEVTNER